MSNGLMERLTDKNVDDDETIMVSIIHIEITTY